MHSPVQYISFWLFVIALAVLVITVFYAFQKGQFGATQVWIVVISALVAIFGLWLLILNYSNDALYLHNMKMHAGQMESEGSMMMGGSTVPSARSVSEM